MRVALAFGLLANGVLVAFLVALSGFVFEGPEGMRGDPSTVALWGGALVAIIAASVAGLVMARRGRPDIGATVAWAPPFAALLFALASL